MSLGMPLESIGTLVSIKRCERSAIGPIVERLTAKGLLQRE